MDIISDSSPSSSSSSDDDMEIVVNIINMEALLAKPKNYLFVERTVPQYCDEQFVGHFRISREKALQLAEMYENSNYYPKKDTGFPRVTAYKSILLFLWFAGHEAASFRDIADRFDVALSTMHKIIAKVTLYISNLSPQYIKWPSQIEIEEISQGFEEMGFAGAIGCIDGSHVRIDTPKEDHESYLNRKKYHSVQMQVVCDDRKRIRDVFIGFPGSVHDARVFKNSPLQETLVEKCHNRFILGDSAYPCLRNLLTPYRDNGRLTRTETNYNKKLSHCRILIEHTFGILKQKFRQLYHIKLHNVEQICHFIRACCVLYNLSDGYLNVMDENGEHENNEPARHLNETEDMFDEEGDDVGKNYRNYIASMLDL